MKRTPNSSQLERWFGREIGAISKSMRGYKGPPIPVGHTPGGSPLFVHSDGGFTGAVKASKFACLGDYVSGVFKGLAREMGSRFNAPIVSITDFENAMLYKTGQRQDLFFAKAPNSGIGSQLVSGWAVGTSPAVGATGAAAPGGTVYNKASTGALPMTDALPGQELFLAEVAAGSTSPTTLMIADRLFAVAKNMTINTAEAITGVPTRYQSSNTAQWDRAAGNTLVPFTTTTLAAGGHIWDDVQYVDDNGNARTVPAFAGQSGSSISRMDVSPVATDGFQWFVRLASDSAGIKSLTQMKIDTALASGGVELCIQRPIIFLPCYTATAVFVFKPLIPMWLPRVLDDAALTVMDLRNTNTPTYSGSIALISN